MLIAVTGAAGYVGRFVVAELQGGRHRVRAWARPGTDRGGFAGPVEWVEGDLGRPESFAPLLAGTDALVHAAYAHLPGRYRGGDGDDLDGYLSVNLGGSLRLLDAARQTGVQRCVFLSSRAVYGRRIESRVLDEDHPVLPDSNYGAYKAAVEAFVASFAADGWDVCALRPTGVYGLTHPVERSKWFELVRTAIDGEAWPRARGSTEVHGADVASAVALLLEADGVAGRAFNCSDLYVTDRAVAEIVQGLTGSDGPLPDAPALPPANVMDCGALQALGSRFGGRALLERTVAELVEAVERRS